MAGRKKQPGRRLARRWVTARIWCARRSASVARAAGARLRPWRPEVQVDVNGKRGRRLRAAITRVTRSHLRALGVAPPERLLVVVQRTVVLDRTPLTALLQVFEGESGPTRHVLFLATSVGDCKVGSEEVVATLRQQLQRVVAGALGTPTNTATEAPPGEAEAAAAPPPPKPRDPPPLEELAATPTAFGGLNGAFPITADR